jgi:hypothetical protein
MDSKSQQIYGVNWSSHFFFCDILACHAGCKSCWPRTSEFSWVLIMCLNLKVITINYLISTIQLPLEFFSFLFFSFLRHKWRNSLQRQKKRRSIIVHHQGNKGVWPHTWPGPSTNKASFLGLLYTPSLYMPTPNLFAKPHSQICLWTTIFLNVFFSYKMCTIPSQNWRRFLLLII